VEQLVYKNKGSQVRMSSTRMGVDGEWDRVFVHFAIWSRGVQVADVFAGIEPDGCHAITWHFKWDDGDGHFVPSADLSDAVGWCVRHGAQLVHPLVALKSLARFNREADEWRKLRRIWGRK
jgi:hypothetical protein